jgi:hypothetical protein
MLPSPRTKGLRFGGDFISKSLVGSLTLRPGDSLTIPRMAWPGGFLRFVSSTEATQATGVLTVPPVGLSPTEQAAFVGHASPQELTPDQGVNLSAWLVGSR